MRCSLERISSVTMLYTLLTTAYLDADVGADTSVCYIDASDWETRLLESPDIRRLFAVITFSKATNEEAVTRICAVDHLAIRYTLADMENPIFVPLWMMPDTATIGERVDVNFFSQDAFPEASRIVLKPLDYAFYNVNVKDMLTDSLTRLGVLKKGDTILLSWEGSGEDVPERVELGFYVVDVEPADVVLLNAEEVVVEFEEAADRWDGQPPGPAESPGSPASPGSARPGTPIPGQLERLHSFVQETIAEAPSQPPGVILGGGPVRRMADGRPWNPYRQQR